MPGKRTLLALMLAASCGGQETGGRLPAPPVPTVSDGGSGRFTCGPQVACGKPTPVDSCTDPLNCGGCGVICPAGQICNQGVCASRP